MKRKVHIQKDSLTVKHRSFLKKLSRSAFDKEKVAKILEKASPNEIRALTEVALNLLTGNFPEKNQKFVKTLNPFKVIIRKLGDPNIKPARKKAILSKQNLQSGGLPFLIPLLSPIIGSLISAGISAAI